MPQCLTFSHNTTDSNGQEYAVYLADFNELGTCGDSSIDEHVIMSGMEFIKLQSSGAENFLTALMDPAYISTGQYQMLFMLGLTTPLFGYFASWAYQTVINFMTKDY
jgi:hypothetical protein